MEERGTKLPVTVEHAQVAGVEKQRAPRRSRPSDVIKIKLQGGNYLCFRDFEGGDLDGALALLEHCTGAEGMERR